MSFWLYFSAQPLFWLILTLTTYVFALWVNRQIGGSALLHPVLVSLAVLIGFLLLTGTPYEEYFEGAQFIHFLLGPATVALAIPLYDHRARIKPLFLPLIVTCVVGAVTAAGVAVGVALLLGGAPETVLSLAPKSVTSPIAMGIAEKIGGYPSLAAGLVLITGAFGCLVGSLLFRLLRVRDDAVKGFTLGLAAHGMGTAYAFELSAVAGAFGGLAMGLTGMLSAFLLPLLVDLFGL